jgi:hypothetical protein
VRSGHNSSGCRAASTLENNHVLEGRGKEEEEKLVKDKTTQFWFQ